MKLKPVLLLAISLFTTQLFAFNDQKLPAGSSEQFTTTKEKLGYAMGLEMGNSFRKLQIDVDAYTYMLGMRDAMTRGRLRMTQEDMKSILISFRKEMMAQTPGYEAKKEKNQREGDAFLEANKKRPGVITLKDGLQYKIIKEGDESGINPSEKDIVSINYEGFLINGKTFDSAFKHKAMTFQVDTMIPGWTEALKLMKPGSIWEIYVPAPLAYNELGSQPMVGPEQTLVYRIKLLEIQKQEVA